MDITSVKKRFEAACLSPDNVIRRQSSVESQFMRNRWEIADNKGLIRITEQQDGLFHIETWAAFDFTVRVCYAPYEKELVTKEIFSHLKKCFFGTFKEDRSYLKKIGAL